MEFNLAPGARTAHALTILAEIRERLASIRSAGSGQAVDVFNNYVRWAGTYLPVLSSVVGSSTLDRLVTSRGYYLIHGVDPRALGQQLTSLVLSEVELRVRDFDAVIEEVRARQHDWQSEAALLVPNTSVLMGQKPYLPDAAWETLVPDASHGIELVLPRQVLVELDGLKDRGDAPRKTKPGEGRADDANTRVRALRVMAWLEANVPDPRDRFEVRPVNSSSEGGVWGRLLLVGVHHVPLPVADSEIIARALEVQQLADRPVTLVTYDRPMLFSARRFGLKAVRPSS